MKNIKKIISAVAAISILLTGMLGISAEEIDERTIIKDEEFLSLFFDDYTIAYCKDNGIIEQLGVYSNDSIALRLAEPIVFARERREDEGTYSYDNINDNEVISGYIPTPDDFPEFDGITNITFSGYNAIARNLVIVFENTEYALDAFYKTNEEVYNNPIIGDSWGIFKPMKAVYVGVWFGNEDIPNPVYGDISCDGEINTNDLITLAKYVCGKLQNFNLLVGKYQADINQDSKIDSDDLLMMIKILTGEINQQRNIASADSGAKQIYPNAQTVLTEADSDTKTNKEVDSGSNSFYYQMLKKLSDAKTYGWKIVTTE